VNIPAAGCVFLDCTERHKSLQRNYLPISLQQDLSRGNPIILIGVKPFQSHSNRVHATARVGNGFIHPEARMAPSDKRLRMAREAAEYLGISLTTLYRIEKEGLILPLRTRGGHRRYRLEMLEGYLRTSRERWAFKGEL